MKRIFFNGLATPLQFLLCFEKTAGVPLHPKSVVKRVTVKMGVSVQLDLDIPLYSVVMQGVQISTFLNLKIAASDQHAVSFN